MGKKMSSTQAIIAISAIMQSQILLSRLQATAPNSDERKEIEVLLESYKECALDVRMEEDRRNKA